MEKVHNTIADETFRGMIRRLNVLELLLFFVVIPVVMAIIFFLPMSIKNSYFILYSNNPNVFSLFLSNYTHSDPLHFASNLTVYLVVTFLLFNIETSKRTFRVVMVLVFLLLPWILSISTISLIKNLPPSQGVSGIVAALEGYLTFVVYKYIRRTYQIAVTRLLPLLVFAANMLVVVVALVGFTELFYTLIGFIIVTAALTMKTMIATLKELFHRMKLIDNLNVSKGRKQLVFNYRFAVTFVTTLLIFTVFLLIPKNPVEGSTLTNSLAHYLGYIYGLFVPLIGDMVFEMLGFIQRSAGRAGIQKSGGAFGSGGFD